MSEVRLFQDLENDLNFFVCEDSSEVVDDVDAWEALPRGGEGLGGFPFHNGVESEQLREGENEGSVEYKGAHSHSEHGAFYWCHRSSRQVGSLEEEWLAGGGGGGAREKVICVFFRDFGGS